MTGIYKNTRQQEFVSLMETLLAIKDESGDSKYSAADVARWVKRTPGAISQYISGYGNPREDVVDRFREKVEELTGGKKESETSVNQLHQQLDDLQRLAPPDYDVARTIIGSLHKKLPLVIKSKPTPKSASVAVKVSAISPGTKGKVLSVVQRGVRDKLQKHPK